MTFRGFRTRAQLGLRSAKSVSRNITPGGAGGGVTLHYGGGKTGITAKTAHSSCERTWRSYQSYHIDGNRWADIAYTMGACQHGYLLAGRGAGVRTAANGSNKGNQVSYAICWIGGSGDSITQDALDAIDEGIRRLRSAGAGTRVWPHKNWTSTSCPGGALSKHASARNRKAIPGTTGVTAPAPDLAKESNLLVVDGKLGPATVRTLQHYLNAKDLGRRGDIAVDGVLGKATIAKLQWMVGATPDGIFGAKSARALEKWLGVKQEKVAGLYPGVIRRLQERLNAWLKEAS